MSIESKIFALLIITLFLIPSVTPQQIAIAQPSTNSAPATEWQQEYGDKRTESVSNLIQTSDGGYAFSDLGWSHQYTLVPSTIYKVDSSGNVQWYKTINFFRAADLVQTNDGGYAILGIWDTYGTTYQYTPTLIKTNSAGIMQWNQNYSIGEPNDSFAVRLLLSNDSGFALLFKTTTYEQGLWQRWATIVKTDSTGKMEWNNTFSSRGNYTSISSLIQTSDGGYMLLGSTSFNGTVDTPNSYYWLAKIDSNGSLQFSREYGDGPNTLNTNSLENEGFSEGVNRKTFGDNEAMSIAENGNGGFIIAGTAYPEGHYSLWDSINMVETLFVRIDSNGDTQWSRIFNGYVVSPIIQTSDYGYAFTKLGEIIKLNFEGTMEWSKNLTYSRYGSLSSLSLSSLIQASDGSLVGTGTGSGASPSYLGNIFLVKTEAFLPLPSPTQLPTPIPTPIVANVKLALILVIIVLVFITAVAVSILLYGRHRKTVNIIE